MFREARMRKALYGWEGFKDIQPSFSEGRIKELRFSNVETRIRQLLEKYLGRDFCPHAFVDVDLEDWDSEVSKYGNYVRYGRSYVGTFSISCGNDVVAEGDFEAYVSLDSDDLANDYQPGTITLIAVHWNEF